MTSNHVAGEKSRNPKETGRQLVLDALVQAEIPQPKSASFKAMPIPIEIPQPKLAPSQQTLFDVEQHWELG